MIDNICMRDDIFKHIRESVKTIDKNIDIPNDDINDVIDNAKKQQLDYDSTRDKYYALINNQTGDIIHLDTSRNYYYRGINSLYRAYKRCLNNSNISINNIGFKELKLTSFDLSTEDNDKLMNLIHDNKINYSNKLIARVVKMHGLFYINFIKENKSVKCWITCHKSKNDIKRGIYPGFYVYDCENRDWENPCYYAETMPKLRELLVYEVKKGNIEIPEAGLYVED